MAHLPLVHKAQIAVLITNFCKDRWPFLHFILGYLWLKQASFRSNLIDHWVSYGKATFA